MAGLSGLAALGACSHASAHLMVDAPKLMQYQAPDIDEITGIESSDEAAEAAKPGGESSSNSQAQSPHK